MALPTLEALIRDVDIAMLVTVDPDGLLRSRPLRTLQIEREVDAELALWFLTARDAGEVAEIEAACLVNLSYADPAAQRYVSVSGIAELSADPGDIRRRWQPSYSEWFPNGPDDPSLQLIRVRVIRAEYWDRPPDGSQAAITAAQTLVTGKAPEPEHHDKIELADAPTTGRGLG